jgi:D-sedoheptulose 7-phosphate isomerase
MGNGGSSCDAAHITTEFMHPVTTGRKALSFTNLTADIATMTAVANDVGNASVEFYVHFFERKPAWR